MNNQEVITALKGKLFVISCQALPGEPISYRSRDHAIDGICGRVLVELL